MSQAIVMSLLQAPWMWHDGGHMSMHWGWWIFLLALLVLLGWVAVVGASGSGRAPSQRESAEEALRRRFAEGEIGEEEFQRRLDALRKSR